MLEEASRVVFSHVFKPNEIYYEYINERFHLNTQEQLFRNIKISLICLERAFKDFSALSFFCKKLEGVRRYKDDNRPIFGV